MGLIKGLVFVTIIMAHYVSAANGGFVWGAASAAYQSEGHIFADNRGKSIWDVYLSDESLAGPGISGATSINFYDPAQYQEDIALLKRLGLNGYRFSVSWSRIMPDGLGPVNMAGINHYRDFITHLKEAGIEPLLTLYHFDMPVALSLAGGWEQRDSVNWFKRYSEVIFDHFHDLVDNFALVNQPTTEVLIKNQAANLRAGESADAVHNFPVDRSDLEVSLRIYNHILLASAAAKEVFDAKGYTGEMGLALEISPVAISDDATPLDIQMARLVDGITFRWFLDSTINGVYPEDILDLCHKLRIDPGIKDGDAARIGKAALDYVGANYYIPTYIRAANGTSSDALYAPETYIPEGKETMLLGAVEPQAFKDVMLRIKNEYKNIPVYVTENGASFQNDDIFDDGKVLDKRRCRYVVSHVQAMQEAQAEGADVRGYYLWSNSDNLEWFNGYKPRFGFCHVNFDNQVRTPKLTAKVYSSIIKGEKVTLESCDVSDYEIDEKEISSSSLLGSLLSVLF